MVTPPNTRMTAPLLMTRRFAGAAFPTRKLLRLVHAEPGPVTVAVLFESTSNGERAARAHGESAGDVGERGGRAEREDIAHPVGHARLRDPPAYHRSSPRGGPPAALRPAARLQPSPLPQSDPSELAHVPVTHLPTVEQMEDDTCVGILGRAGGRCGFRHDFGNARNTARGRRVRADDDRAPSLDRDEDLVERR